MQVAQTPTTRDTNDSWPQGHPDLLFDYTTHTYTDQGTPGISAKPNDNMSNSAQLTGSAEHQTRFGCDSPAQHWLE